MRGASRCSGFTLVELLVSIVIVGIVLSIAVLSLNLAGDDRDVRKEAQRFMSIMETAQDDALLQGRDFGVEFLAASYRFVEYDPDTGQWFEMPYDEVLRTRTLPEDYELRLFLEDKQVLLEQDPVILDEEDEATNTTLREQYAPHVLIFSSGDMTPFELHFNRLTDNRAVALEGDLLGNLDFASDDDQDF